MSGGWGTPRMTPEPQEEPAAAVVLPGRVTIGRVVHYVALGDGDGTLPSRCRAAIVADVDDERVTVAVLNPDRVYFEAGVAYDVEQQVGTWHWPERA